MKNISKWTAREIPPLSGRLAVVTGTGGLGYEDALELSCAGCEIIIAGRNKEKGDAAVANIRTQVPSARVRFEQLDLASLDSVSDFAFRLSNQCDALDLLINNAGVMVPPKRLTTADGFELQFGTNYLGHFALTAHLLPMLQNGIDSRVITLSSIAARSGRINFSDLQFENRYSPMTAYSQSKLACLMFALELQRRCDAYGWNVASLAAHPGISRTDLLHNAPGRWSIIGMTRSLLWFLFQRADQGALPTLFAATAADALPGSYYGPNKFAETRGGPALAKVPAEAIDVITASRLWTISEKLANVKFPEFATSSQWLIA